MKYIILLIAIFSIKSQTFSNIASAVSDFATNVASAGTNFG